MGTLGTCTRHLGLAGLYGLAGKLFLPDPYFLLHKRSIDLVQLFKARLQFLLCKLRQRNVAQIQFLSKFLAIWIVVNQTGQKFTLGNGRMNRRDRLRFVCRIVVLA